MPRAVVVSERLPYAGYLVYRLWEVDEQGARVAVRCLTPVRLVGGQPDPVALAAAKLVIGALADQRGLEITSFAWE